MSRSPQPPRVLPPDVYDTLELAALAYGGVGAGRFFDDSTTRRLDKASVPYCIHGMAYVAGDFRYTDDTLDDGDVQTISNALHAVGISFIVHDMAVRAINARHGKTGLQRNERVPFAAWCRELNVVRGPATEG